MVAAGRALPASPYASGAVAFARSVGSGKKIQDAALSGAGRALLKEVKREGVDLKHCTARPVGGDARRPNRLCA